MTKHHTMFMDMYSGGSTKTEWDYIIVNLPEDEAVEWFRENFQDPYDVTCDCCGSDYAVMEYRSLKGALTKIHSDEPYKVFYNESI